MFIIPTAQFLTGQWPIHDFLKRKAFHLSCLVTNASFHKGGQILCLTVPIWSWLICFLPKVVMLACPLLNTPLIGSCVHWLPSYEIWLFNRSYGSQFRIIFDYVRVVVFLKFGLGSFLSVHAHSHYISCDIGCAEDELRDVWASRWGLHILSWGLALCSHQNLAGVQFQNYPKILCCRRRLTNKLLKTLLTIISLKQIVYKNLFIHSVPIFQSTPDIIFELMKNILVYIREFIRDCNLLICM